MKKTLFMLFAILSVALASCSKDDDELENKNKSYQIENELVYESSVPAMNGTMYTSIIVEFDKNDVAIKQDQLGNIAPRMKSKEIIADENCSYIAVTFFALPTLPIYESVNKRIAVVEKFYLNENGLKVATIDNSSKVTTLDK